MPADFLKFAGGIHFFNYMNYNRKIILFYLFILASVSFPQTTHTLSVEYKIKNLPFGLTERVAKPMPEIGIALSGGGARGLAQIGVIKALLDSKIPLDVIVGTSMGSIIGGLYAAGYSIDQIDSIARNTNWDNLLASDRETNRRELFVDQKITEDKAIFSLRLKGLKPVLPTALSSGQKISNFLNLLTFQAPIHSDSSFDELRVKYRAVCSNLVTGSPVVINSGSLSEAMRASSSVSFFLAPVQLDSLTLVDGGLVANIPVKITSSLGGQYIIAVNTTSALHPQGELTLPWEVADQVVSIPMKRLNEDQLKYANDIITPDLGSTALDDFSNVDSLINQGYSAAINNVSKIKSQIDSVFVRNLNVKEYYIKNVLVDTNAAGVERLLQQQYSMMDSVSNIRILKDMYSLYSSGDYENISADISQSEKYSTVKINAVTNPEIKSIETPGITLINTASVNSILSGLIKKPYNAGKIVSKVIQILDEYRSEGFSLADVRRISFNKESGNLRISFNEGRIDSILVEGDKYTSRTIITREIPVAIGSYLSYSEIKDGLTNLRSTNLFEDVFISAERKGGKNILVVRVKEKAASLLRVGFRVDNENKAQLSLGLVDENLFGSGTELGLLLIGGERNRDIEIEHKSNRVFNTYLTYKLNAYYKFNDVYSYADVPQTTETKFSRISNGEYRQSFYGGSFSLGTQVQRFGNLIFEGRYQIDQIRNLQVQTDLPIGTEPYGIQPSKVKIVSLSVSSTIDTQDRYPYPKKGFYFKGEYEAAQTVLGSDLGYTKLYFNYKSYFTLNNVNTFSPRFAMGFADKTLPLSEQFSLGGQSSFFGMRDNEFRGRQIFLASLEYRYELPVKIFFDTYLKFRYDIGSTWDEQEEIRLKDLRHGIGSTLSFDTPIGPADFSIGKSFLFVKNLPGNPLSWGDTFFYFSIGYYY